MLQLHRGGSSRVILCQISRLEGLDLGDLKLVRGSWEAFFEDLARFKRLTELTLKHENCHLYSDNEQLDDRHPTVFAAKLEGYVINGGRHPCLSEGQPDSTARDWLAELDPHIQDRIG